MIRIIGRIFLSLLFIVFGISSIVNWDISYTDLDSALVNWQMYSGNTEFIGAILDQVVNYVPILLAVGIFLQIIGGLLVFIGFKPRLGALMLILYLFFATLIYFPFWFYEGTQMSFNFVLFLKNISILGGLFLVLPGGGGARSYEMMDDDL